MRIFLIGIMIILAIAIVLPFLFSVEDEPPISLSGNKYTLVRIMADGVTLQDADTTNHADNYFDFGDSTVDLRIGREVSSLEYSLDVNVVDVTDLRAEYLTVSGKYLDHKIDGFVFVYKLEE